MSNTRSDLHPTVTSTLNPKSPPMDAKRPRSGDLPLHPTSSSPEEASSAVHSFLSLPALRIDWSNLGDGPSGLIAERLLADEVTDYVRFRAVCRPWRQCTADPRAHGTLDRRFLPRRWIMLREKVADPERRRLLNISTGRCVRAHLPGLRGHDLCEPTVDGLLVLLNRSTYAVRLLNPLTGQASDLPPATTLYSQYWGAGMSDVIPRVDFNVSYAGLAGDATVAVLFGEVQMLAIAKPDDEQWALVKQDILLSAAISFAGRFYCTSDSDIKMVDISDNQPPRLVVAAENNHQISRMVDNDGELLMLSHIWSEVEDFGGEVDYFMEYKVYRVDLDARKTEPICDLGGRALFIGSIRAISVSPLAFPGIEKNSFYVGDEVCSYDKYIEEYKIADGTATISFLEGSDFTEAIGSDTTNSRYGPCRIVDYLSEYVLKDTSDSLAEEDTSDSLAEDDTSDSDDVANCVIC